VKVPLKNSVGKSMIEGSFSFIELSINPGRKFFQFFFLSSEEKKKSE